MDLSWCIICDNRIDSTLNESDLYCSDACKVKDSSSFSSAATTLPLKRSSSFKLRKQQRPAAPSTSYPWIPLYRRRPAISRKPAPCRSKSAAPTFYRPHPTAA
ncbi:hypothetical protein BJV82DRAFT_622458 [Fennellomyces sp. T-0311]|nr:hypothetical protein BJV82DRAFT_622458 [Fennellomyces sp. T-0311]